MSSDPDDDKTIIAGSSAPAPEPPPDSALPIGTRVAEFEIVGLIGIGGFGIVYLAQDHSLGRRVALKEYMPQSLARRSGGVTVSVRSARQAETFDAGLRSFVNEAHLLAQFDHPSLVKVHRFWEANGTAYMVMPYYQGRTLKEALQTMAGPPDQAWLEHLLDPLLDALQAMHGANVYHRDIAPDNILLLAGDRPLLLDFGAARHVITDMTQALTVILKPGYAPIEQYAEVPDLKQGAWTDLYALAAVMYFAITGKTPMPSVGRMLNDSLPPLVQVAEGRYSRDFLAAIDSALAVRPTDRPQSVAEFRSRLGAAARAAGRAEPKEAPPAPQAAPAPASATVSDRRAAPRPMLWSGAAGLAGVVALAAYLGFGGSAPEPAATSIPPGPVADAPNAVPPAAAPTAAAPAQPTRPFSPLDEIDRIFEQRDRDHHVGVTMARSRVAIGRERLSFDVSSSKAGYVYVLMVGTDRQHFYLLFPNQIDADNRIAAGGHVELPRKGWSMVATGPAGTNQFVAVVSEVPRNFESAGLVVTDPFGEFPLDVAERVARAATGPASPFAGTPVCPAAGPCPTGYGAATFSIEEFEAPKR